MLTGKVRWYSSQGFGFIDQADGGEAFYFHIRNVEGQRILKTGDAVTFDGMQAPKGPKAMNVKFVGSRTEEAKNHEHAEPAVR